MHTTTKPERRVAAIGASLALLTCSLIGCAPDPAPTPTPTPAFASEDEAFAAAEEVYRAYNEALNAERTGETTKNPSRFLIGGALESDLDADSYLDEQGFTIAGATTFSQFGGLHANYSNGESNIRAQLCLDVSGTQILDGDGLDVTPANRPNRLPLDVTFIGTGEALQISSSNLIENKEC